MMNKHLFCTFLLLKTMAHDKVKKYPRYFRGAINNYLQL